MALGSASCFGGGHIYLTGLSGGAVPEPSTLAMLCMGVVGFLTYTRRRRKH